MRAEAARAYQYQQDNAIIGIGRSRFGRRLDRTWTSLAIEACDHALCDAGLPAAAMDGLGVHGGTAGLPGLSSGGVRGLAQALGLYPTWHSGSTEPPDVFSSLVPMMLAVSAGLCERALCLEVRHPGQRTGRSGTEIPSYGATALVISAADLVEPTHRPVWIDAIEAGRAASGHAGDYDQLYDAVRRLRAGASREAAEPGRRSAQEEG